MAAAKYDRIGDGYDRTRRPDPRIAERLISLLDAAPGASVLDVACGTGNYTFALAERGLATVGGDLSQTMLARARAKHPHLPLVRADGAALPFSDDAFTHAITTLAIHHMADLAAVFASVRRVVAGGGRYVIFSALPEQVAAYWLTAYFPAMMAGAVRVCPTRGTVEAALSAAGFRSVALEPWDVCPRTWRTCFSTRGRTARSSISTRVSATEAPPSGNTQVPKYLTDSRGCARTSIRADGRRSVPVPTRGAGTTASSSPNDQPFPLVRGPQACRDGGRRQQCGLPARGKLG